MLSRYDAIRTGETAEVVVLSRSRNFESFKVPFIDALYTFLSLSGERPWWNAAILECSRN